ncbi:MAG: methionine--tRNA ligase subunit beta, partial [bacterium]
VTYNQLEEHFKARAKGEKGFEILRLPPEILIKFDKSGVPEACLKTEIADGVDEHYKIWIEKLVQQAFKSYFGMVENVLAYRLKEALIEIWDLIKLANKFVDEVKPWVLEKEAKKEILDSVFFYLFETIRACALLVSSFTPQISNSIYEQIGIHRGVESESLDNSIRWGVDLIAPGTVTQEPKPIVPRIDADEYLKQHAVKTQQKDDKAMTDEKAEVSKESGIKPEISYDDFAKIDFRVAKVLECNKVEGADKLLHLTIDLGFEQRQIVAGVAQHYSTEEMVGKEIIVVANLAARKVRGVVSHGMLMAASDGDKVILLTTDTDVNPGSTIS